MTAQGPMTRAVNAALRTAPTLPRDGAAVRLAKEYAALIDAAAPAAKYAPALAALRVAVEECSDPDAGKHLEKIEIALSAHSVASDLGPKLLATLTALGMTAAGRGKEGGAPVVPVASKLDEFTARRTGKHAS